MVLLAQTNSILSLITLLVILRILNPSFDANVIVWRGQGTKRKSYNSAAVKRIASIMQTGLQSSNSNCYN